MHGDADRARLIGNRAGDGLSDPPRGVGGELVAAAVFELVHGLHQADVAFLDEVEELQAAVGVFLGDGNDQAQVGLDHLALGLARLLLAAAHLRVDLLEVFQRNDDAGLGVDQALLQFLDGRQIARQDGGVRLVRCSEFLGPFQVELMTREGLDEIFLRHAAAVHDDAADFALVAAHLVDLAAQQIAELFDGARGETHFHQVFGDLLLGFEIAGRFVAVLVVGAAHFHEGVVHLGKALERLHLEFFQLDRTGGGGGFLVVLLGFVGEGEVDILFGHVVVRFVVRHHAVDHLVHRQLVVRDARGHGQDFSDGGGRGGNGQHHLAQAFLDALGDDDLAFAREQFDRTHLAHVHAHRVGGAAEFRIHGRQRGFGFLFRLFLARGGRAVLVEQQGLGVRGLFVHRDAHVVEHADDGFQQIRVGQIVGQVIVDFAVGQETTRLAELDKVLQALAAAAEFLFGDVGVVVTKLLEQLLFLGARGAAATGHWRGWRGAVVGLVRHGGAEIVGRQVFLWLGLFRFGLSGGLRWALRRGLELDGGRFNGLDCLGGFHRLGRGFGGFAGGWFGGG
ncbi:hypothetical protein GALL_264960 [mine drainage metagenome]|uniref:NAD-specific glutamate dehydrogenase n=1 Tax=mine drainage metagenome TaxID=410659 RepID=A0A1J5R6F1_9ZZZZ